MEPFTYPDLPHVRRHSPLGYANADSYRPWLRDEFAFRCVFCLVREQWENPVGRFAVDHLHPRMRYPELAADYDNLLDVCTSCNAVKAATGSGRRNAQSYNSARATLDVYNRPACCTKRWKGGQPQYCSARQLLTGQRGTNGREAGRPSEARDCRNSIHNLYKPFVAENCFSQF